MSGPEHRIHSRSYLKKAEEYLASAHDNLTAARLTPAAGDAIHTGINAKDAIVTALTGSTRRGKDHATAAKGLKQALGRRSEAAQAERSLRRLLSFKSEVEHGSQLIGVTKAEPLVESARSLVVLAARIVRQGA